jgi:hypothetical protein
MMNGWVEDFVDFNLVQLFTANRFSIKEQKRYNGKYTHYTYFSPGNPNQENQHILYSFTHTLFIIQYTYRSQ